MATGNGDGKDNDKSTLSQAGEGANTKEEGDEEEALDEDPGARPRIRRDSWERRRGEASANWGQIIAINLFLLQLLAIIGNYWLLLVLLVCEKYYYYWLLLDYTHIINYWD